MSYNKTELLASSLINDAAKHKELFRLPPSLRNVNNLSEVLSFFIQYYSGKEDITLKNVNQISFSEISISKIHLWMQIIAMSIRIHFLIKYDNDATVAIDKALNFFQKNIPECPLVIRSVAKKYKYISIDNWSDDQFKYCCMKETASIKQNNSLPIYVPENFYNVPYKEEILLLLEDFVKISESLDSEGKYELSEKLLIGTEKMSDKLKELRHDTT